MDIGSVFVNLADTGEPPLIAQLARASWLSGVAKSAVKLDLFTHLNESRRNAEDIAKQLGTNLQHTRELLNSCVAVGLLEKTGDDFENTKEAATYLVKGKSTYFGEAFTYLSDLGPLFAQVDVAMLSDEQMSHEQEFQSEEEEAAYWRHYMLAMDQWGGGNQQDLLLENIDLNGKKRFLDVGGGSGVYTIALCQKYPELKAILFDQEKALPLARSRIEEQKLTQQITCVAGDYHTDPFDSGYDVVLFSGVLIQESVEDQLQLMRKACESMIPGGIVMVQDILKVGSYTETSPKIALESLIASVFFGGAGGVVSADETTELLTSAGFTSPTKIPLPGIYSLVTAIKP